ncbi:hypothetical protein TNCV_5108291 [Trichonephila clavipes]|nr:hypothetical protein TNCV_5108291 [Trichonephila clavipes]
MVFQSLLRWDPPGNFNMIRKISTSTNMRSRYRVMAESVPECDQIGQVTGEVVDRDGHINLEVDSDDIQELLDSHNEELTMDQLIEMHQQEQDICLKLPIKKATVAPPFEGK